MTEQFLFCFFRALRLVKLLVIEHVVDRLVAQDAATSLGRSSSEAAMLPAHVLFYFIFVVDSARRCCCGVTRFGTARTAVPLWGRNTWN